MADKTSLAVAVVVLNKLMDSDDEKPCLGTTRQWSNESGYFNAIIKAQKNLSYQAQLSI